METFSRLIEDAGALLGIEGFSPDAGGVCYLAAEEAQISIIDCSEASGLILITADFAGLDSDCDEELRFALSSNYLFKATHGATISLDPDSGGLALSIYLPVDALTPEMLVERIEAFSSVMFKLRESIDCRTFDVHSESDDEEDGKGQFDIIEADGVSAKVYPSGDSSLIVSVELGELPEGSAILRELMTGNYLFAGTAGAALALDEDRRVVMQQRFWVKESAEDDISGRLAVFFDKAKVWKGKLISGGDEQIPFSPLDDLIRV
ncbi:MAG: type III secretion system chaperone [Kiritimatiellae bacterium]|nr:type III secretion system chaperone [Kiritimatiellia bacterium]